MLTRDLLLHAYVRKEGGVWSACCLEFSLAVQADSCEQARRLLVEQIALYLHDALLGEDQAHAEALLNRRAPWSEWLTFYWIYWGQRLLRWKRELFAFELPVPMKPA